MDGLRKELETERDQERHRRWVRRGLTLGRNGQSAQGDGQSAQGDGQSAWGGCDPVPIIAMPVPEVAADLSPLGSGWGDSEAPQEL